MTTYIILSRFSPQAFNDSRDFKALAEQVSTKIREQCPGVVWKSSFATLGRFDVVDVVEAEDPKQLEKAAMLIRAYGHSTTETLLATPWKEFLLRFEVPWSDAHATRAGQRGWGSIVLAEGSGLFKLSEPI